MEQERRKDFLINTLYFLVISAGVFILCRFLLKYLTPFIIGAVIAWIVQKPSDFLSDKTGIKRTLCATVLAILFFILAAGICVLLSVTVIDAAGSFINEISGKSEEITEFFNNIKNNLNVFFERIPEELSSVTDTIYNNALEKTVSWITSSVSVLATAFAKRAPAFLLSLIVSLVSSCYIAADFPGLMRFVKNLCGKGIYEKTLKVKNIFVNSIFLFVRGYLILMLITFFELLVGLLILKIKFAPLLALLISVIDILPVLGTGTVLVPWAIIEILMKNPSRGVGIIVLYGIITLIRNFAEPRIIGGQMGINPLFTLLSMFVGIKLLGIFGMIVFPITFIVVVKYYKNELDSEKISV